MRGNRNTFNCFEIVMEYCLYQWYQKELLQVVMPQEKAIMETFIDLKNGADIDFGKASQILFEWAQKSIAAV